MGSQMEFLRRQIYNVKAETQPYDPRAFWIIGRKDRGMEVTASILALGILGYDLYGVVKANKKK